MNKMPWKILAKKENVQLAGIIENKKMFFDEEKMMHVK